MGRTSDYSRDMYKQLEEIMGRLGSIEKELDQEKREHKEDVDRLNDRISGLEREVQDKDRQIDSLSKDNERLKRKLANNSSNSSLPPSTDPPGKPVGTYNSRAKSGKKAGGQKGHKGVTLSKNDVIKRIRSGKCEHKIEKIGRPTGKYCTKYVIDLKTVPIIREIRIYADKRGKIVIPPEYRSDVTYGENLKAMAVCLYSEGVMSNDRICSFINTISGNTLSLSEGSVYGFCRSFSEKVQPYLDQIEETLMDAETVCTDATVVTLNGKQAYVRNFSTPNAALYHAMEQKSLEAMRAIRFLTRYAGIFEHDHETAMYHFGTSHGECNVHLMRYLRKNTEEAGNHWSRELTELLSEMNDARKKCIAQGMGSFREEEIQKFEKKYDLVIATGRQQNKKTQGTLAKQEENTLLNRLEKYKENHLLFLHNFSVPFENNLSERDLRKCKNRQKMSGGFRKSSGMEMYCRILSLVETCKRKKLDIYDNIKMVYRGTPAMI